MTQEEMFVLVPLRLKEIEKEYGVKVLMAVESGSRAWGFASEDSDFDVRFIYKRKAEDYLKLEKARDTIELPVDEVWDVCGWDLDKTLRLLKKSNPGFYEWLNSPVRYLDTDFKEEIKDLAELCFSEKKMLNHYLSMASSTYEKYLAGEQVIAKKYFYVLRPVLAALWILKNHTVPPVAFQQLREAFLPAELEGSLDRLMEIKLHGPEKMLVEHDPVMDAFLEEKIAFIREACASSEEKDESRWEQLDAFFLKQILQA